MYNYIELCELTKIVSGKRGPGKKGGSLFFAKLEKLAQYKNKKSALINMLKLINYLIGLIG